ncbi:MAG: peptidylprolyl isomerase [Ignavibacteriaceae bacterium]
MKIIFLILLTICFSNSFSQNIFFEGNDNSKIKNKIVAEAGSIKITAEEFIYSYEFGPAFTKRKENSKLTHLNYMINEKLLALEGYNINVLKKEETKELYHDIESDLAAEEMFRKEILSKVEINDAEIKKIIEKKLSQYELRWLYAENSATLENYLNQLKNGKSFDFLFNSQLTDSVLIDDRRLLSSHYSIYMKNPQFAQIVDTLKAGIISAPIHTHDGWYIIKIDNIIKSMITGEAEYNKLKSESIEAITKSKMDILSNQYVNGLFADENPIIKRDVFNVLRSYLGKFILTSEKYSVWELENKLDNALTNLGLKRGAKYTGLTLVECKNCKISLDEFIIWFRNREQYIKFSKNDLIGFSKSLEDLVWVMVRDKLLTVEAYQKGYNKSEWVRKQSTWWKDKISYSAYRNELANSLTLNSEEKRLVSEKKQSQSEIMSDEISKKILHKILELKKKYKIIINEKILAKIKVSTENDKKAIEMFIAKRGNLIPRPAFPSIDNDWVNWE